jgi:hypothetical protein
MASLFSIQIPLPCLLHTSVLRGVLLLDLVARESGSVDYFICDDSNGHLVSNLLVTLQPNHVLAEKQIKTNCCSHRRPLLRPANPDRRALLSG